MAANFLGKVLLNIQPFLQATKQARDSWGQFNEELEKSAVSARGAALALGGLGGVVVNAFRESLNVFAEFEQGLRNAEIAIGLGSDAMSDLRDAAIEMGNTTQITASTATIALGEMAKAGFDAADSIDAAWGAVSLAIATQGDLQTSSKLIASTIRQFTLEAGEASRVADIFINAIYNSPATLESLAAAMKYAGPIARQYGATLTETVIGLELLLDTGLRGEQAGTALRNMFIRLVNPTAKTRDIIQSMGLTLNQVNPQIVGMYNAVETLANANLSAANATSIFGVRAINAYLTISRAVQNPERRLNDLREKMEEVGTALGAQEAQLDTFRGSWTKLTSALETVQIRAGDIIQKILRPMVDSFRQLVNAFNNAHPSIQGFLIALAGLSGVSLVVVGALVLVGSRITDIRIGLAFAVKAIGQFNTMMVASTRGLMAWSAAMLGAMSAQAIRAAEGAILGLSIGLGKLSPALGNAAFQMLTTSRALTVLRVSLGRIPMLFLLIEGFIALRRNGHALTEVLNALGSLLNTLWRSITSLLDSVFSADSAIGKLIRTIFGFQGSFADVNPVVALFGQVIKGLSGIIVMFTAGLERAIATASSFFAIFTKGPKAAMEEYAASMERIENEMFDRLENIFNPEPIENFVNRTKNLSEVVDDINAMYESFGPMSDQTEDLEVLVGQIDALLDLRDKYEGNADALSLINAEIAKLTDKGEVLEGNLADAAREADRLVASLRGELQDLQISLIADDETRKIAEAQQRYREWFEEIRAQQETNPFMRTEEVDALILQRQKLLQEEITQIMEEEAEKRLRDARDNMSKIIALHEQAEKRIRDLRLAMVGEGRVRLRMEYDEALIEHEKFYENYLAELRIAGQDTKDAMERQRVERRLMEQRYIEDVLALYRDFYTELHDAQARLDSSAVNVGAMTEPVRLQRDLERQLRDIRQHYEQRREQMAGDEAAITRLMQQEAAARELAQLEYLKAINDAHEDYAKRRAEMQRAIQGDLVQLGGDASQSALFDFLGEVNNTVQAYETLADEARKYGRDVQDVYDELHSALLVKEALFQQEMNRINQEANRERLNEAIQVASDALANTSVSQLRILQSQLSLLREAFSGDDSALKAIEDFSQRVDSAVSAAVSTQAQQLRDSLDGMNRDTLVSLREQVEAWRWAYGDNGEALKAIDGAMDNITARIQQLDEEFQESLNNIIDSASEFSRSVSRDLTDLNLSETDRQLLSYLDRAGEAARLMGELRAMLPGATEAQAAAIRSAIGSLAASIEGAARLGVTVAEELARDAVEAYNRGLADAVQSASQEGVSAITGLIRDSLSRVLSANADGLSEARTQLRRLLAELTVAGFDNESLQPIRDYIQEVNGLIDEHAINLADFASQQFNNVRQAANALLEESEARAVTMQTLEDEVELRREALEVSERLAREGALSANAVLNARQNLVTTQLQYVEALRSERDALRENFNATVEFAEVIDGRLGVKGISTLEAMRDVLISQVVAMQNAGAAYEDYSDLLSQAEEINERILSSITTANEKAIATLNELAKRQNQQAEALGTLRSANRAHIESQLESLKVGREQTLMYRQLIRSVMDNAAATEQQAGALERLVEEQLALGDVSSAIQSQQSLVDVTNKQVSSLRGEITALKERAEAMRRFIRDNEDAQKGLNKLVDSIRQVGNQGLPDEDESSFDEWGARMRRRDLIEQLKNQNLSLEQQRGILEDIDNITKDIAKHSRDGTGLLGSFEDADLRSYQSRMNQEINRQNADAKKQTELAERTAAELQQKLIGTLDDLSVAIDNLNGMLSNLFDVASEDTEFDSIYDNIIGDISRFPEDMALMIAAMQQLDEEAQLAAASLAQALDIGKYTADGKATVDGLIEALSVYGTTDFSSLGGASGTVFREAFEAEAKTLMDNLIEELGSDRLNEAIRSWQSAEGLPQVGAEIGKPIGEQAAIALVAALREGYDPSSFVEHLNAQNAQASASIESSASELGANAGRAAAQAMMNAMVVAATGEGVNVSSFLQAALPTESVVDEGLRVGQDVLDGVLSGVGNGSDSWRGVSKEFSAALTENLVDPAEDMGREAGVNFVGALIQGINSQKDALIGAIRNLLAGVDDYLPHSDARKGPLSTLTQSGREFTRTFGKGALSQKDWLSNRVGAALGAALPSVASASVINPMTPNVAPGALGGPVTVNVDGRSESAPGPLALDARRLVAQVDRELRMKGIGKS